ncbi:MAG: hypothetical protein WB805_15620 [Candidatus Dormiibacterota bacterium]
MNDESSDPDLGFPSTVLQAFAFLQGTYGFQVDSVAPTVVRFQSNRLFVNVWHEQRSHELGLSIGRRSRPAESSHPFNVADILYLTEPAKAAAYRDHTALTVESVRAGIEALADELQTYGSEALTGANEVFDKIAGDRTQRVESYALALGDAHVRSGVAEAWARQDFAEAARLLGTITERLSPAELAKLEYAQHQRGDRPEN